MSSHGTSKSETALFVELFVTLFAGLFEVVVVVVSVFFSAARFDEVADVLSESIFRLELDADPAVALASFLNDDFIVLSDE